MTITMPRLPIDIERAILPGLRDFPNQRYDYAPYGILWYALNLPIGRIVEDGMGYLFVTGIISVTIVEYLFLFKINLWFNLLFTTTVIFHIVKAPWNCSILWLCLLGFVNPLLLAIPILAKFPVGNRQAKWTQTRQALLWQKNPVYWGSLVMVWMAILIIRLPTHLLPFA